MICLEKDYWTTVNPQSILELWRTFSHVIISNDIKLFSIGEYLINLITNEI